jgi:hypothetical protein
MFSARSNWRHREKLRVKGTFSFPIEGELTFLSLWKVVHAITACLGSCSLGSWELYHLTALARALAGM